MKTIGGGGQFSQTTLENYGTGVAVLSKIRVNEWGQAVHTENVGELCNRGGSSQNNPRELLGSRAVRTENWENY